MKRNGKKTLASKCQQTQDYEFTTLFRNTLRYGSELWIMNRKEQKQLEAAQMHSLRPLLGLTRWNKERKFDMNKLNQDNIVYAIRKYP
jgi:hypothetical protein